MARTEAPAPPVAAPNSQATAPPMAAPMLVWPQPQPTRSATALDEPKPRSRRERGMPVAPAMTAAGNVLTMAGTAAYETGGWPALAATGVVAAGSTAAAAVKRRATVKRRMAATGGGARGGQRRASSGSGSTGLGSRSSGSRTGRGGGSGGGIRGGSSSGSQRRSPGGGGRGVTADWPSSGSSSRRGPAARGGLLGKGGGQNSGNGRHGAGGPSTGSSGKNLRGGQSGKRAGLAAAAGRAARDGARPGSLPRRVAGAVGRTVARPFRQGSMARRAGGATGRGIGKAWTVSKPHRTTARKTTGRGLKRLRAAAWDGIKAVGAGVWALRKKDRKAAFGRLKEAWKRHRKNRAEKAKTKAAPAEPAVATTVRRPTTTIPATFTGGTAMSAGYHFVAPAAEAARAAANYQPTGMMQVGADFAGLQEALELHAQAMKVTVENADAKYPLAPQIVDIMQQVHQLQIKAAELAQELTPAFRKLHDVDIARIENPRKGHTGERMWDVSANL